MSLPGRLGQSKGSVARGTDSPPKEVSGSVASSSRGQRNISLANVERLAKALAVAPWELLHPGREGRGRH